MVYYFLGGITLKIHSLCVKSGVPIRDKIWPPSGRGLAHVTQVRNFGIPS